MPANDERSQLLARLRSVASRIRLMAVAEGLVCMFAGWLPAVVLIAAIDWTWDRFEEIPGAGRLALTAAETGHLVFGTLHTVSATKTVDRIIDVFPGEEKDMVRAMLSESLQAVISQTLIKNREGNGRVAAHEIMLGTPAIRNLIQIGRAHV